MQTLSRILTAILAMYGLGPRATPRRRPPIQLGRMGSRIS